MCHKIICTIVCMNARPMERKNIKKLPALIFNVVVQRKSVHVEEVKIRGKSGSQRQLGAHVLHILIHQLNLVSRQELRFSP